MRNAVGGIAAAVCFGCLAISCTSPQDAPQPEGPPPTAQQWADAQERRAAAIPSLSLRGHADFDWRDAAGQHFDDGDFDIIFRAPSELCLRLSKVGQKLLWIGAGGGQAWVIFLSEKPVRAMLRLMQPAGGGSPRPPHGLGDAMPGIERLFDPDRLAEALGIGRASAADVQSIAWDGPRAAWAVALPSRRVFVRGESLLPVGIDWLNASGGVTASCTLTSFDWLRSEQAIAAAESSKPLVPTRIRLEVWSGGRVRSDGAPDGVLLLAAGEPTDAAARIKPQMFSWDDVRGSTRAEVIVAWE
jgi:hypothetical protein